MRGKAKGAHLLDGRAGGAEAKGGLERVIDPPLEAREGTDHDDTGAQAAPHAHGSELRQNLAGRLVALAHLRDHLQHSEEGAKSIQSMHGRRLRQIIDIRQVPTTDPADAFNKAPVHFVTEKIVIATILTVSAGWETMAQITPAR